MPRGHVGLVDDEAAQHEEEHVGRAVVEQRLEVDERAQALGEPRLFEHGDDGDGVGRREHRAKEQALAPSPVVREGDSDERSGDPRAQEHPGPGQEQRGREKAPNDVPLQGKGARKEQDRQEAREEEVWVDAFPEPRARGEQGPLGGEGLEGDAQEDAPDLLKERKKVLGFFCVGVRERERGGKKKKKTKMSEKTVAFILSSSLSLLSSSLLLLLYQQQRSVGHPREPQHVHREDADKQHEREEEERVGGGRVVVGPGAGGGGVGGARGW